MIGLDPSMNYYQNPLSDKPDDTAAYKTIPLSLLDQQQQQSLQQPMHQLQSKSHLSSQQAQHQNPPSHSFPSVFGQNNSRRSETTEAMMNSSTEHAHAFMKSRIARLTGWRCTAWHVINFLCTIAVAGLALAIYVRQLELHTRIILIESMFSKDNGESKSAAPVSDWKNSIGNTRKFPPMNVGRSL